MLFQIMSCAAWIDKTSDVYTLTSTTLKNTNAMYTLSGCNENLKTLAVEIVVPMDKQNKIIEAYTMKCFKKSFDPFKMDSLGEDTHMISFCVEPGFRLMNINIFSMNNRYGIHPTSTYLDDYQTYTNVHSIIINLSLDLIRNKVKSIILTPEIMAYCGIQVYGVDNIKYFVLSSGQQDGLYYADGIEIRYNDIVSDNELTLLAKKDLKDKENAERFSKRFCQHLTLFNSR